MTFDLHHQPATDLSDALQQHFRADGWRERGEVSVLGCCWPTSFKTGWRELCRCVIQDVEPPPLSEWQGEWEDHAGNRIAYTLRSDTTNIHGYAVFAPKAIVKYQDKMYADVRRQHPK